MMFRYLLQKEWIQIRRNTFVVRLIIFFPVDYQYGSAQHRCIYS